MADSILAQIANPVLANIPGAIDAGRITKERMQTNAANTALTNQKTTDLQNVAMAQQGVLNTLPEGLTPFEKNMFTLSVRDPEGYEVVSKMKGNLDEQGIVDFGNGLAASASVPMEQSKPLLKEAMKRLDNKSPFIKGLLEETLEETDETTYKTQILKLLGFVNKSGARGKQFQAQQKIGIDQQNAATNAMNALTNASKKPELTADEKNYIRTLTDPAYAAFLKDMKQSGSTTDAQVFLENIKKAWKDSHNGEEIPAKELVKAQLQLKRPQAAEIGATEQAKSIVTLKFAERIKNAEKLGTRLAEISTAAELLDAKGEITAKAKKATASKQLSGVIATMAKAYKLLDDKNAIINIDKSASSNVKAFLGASKPGQYLQNMVGSDIQSIRNSIKNKQPALINMIRQASEMGVRGLDTPQELQFHLQATGDPSKDIQSNLAALVVLDDQYGTGTLRDELEGVLDPKVLVRVMQEGADISKKILEEQNSKVPKGVPSGSIDQGDGTWLHKATGDVYGKKVK